MLRCYGWGRGAQPERTNCALGAVGLNRGALRLGCFIVLGEVMTCSFYITHRVSVPMASRASSRVKIHVCQLSTVGTKTTYHAPQGQDSSSIPRTGQEYRW